MNKMMMVTICLAILLISGCRDRAEQRYKCSSFTTPWSYSTTYDDGAIWWEESKNMGWKSYRVPYGDICGREKRNKKAKP